MEVTAKLVSTFAKYQKGGNNKVLVKEGGTVLDLVKELGLPRKYVRIITVNGKQGDLNTVLANGDTVFLFPPAIGGG